jgi:ABC-2 type transport system permease protein
MAGWLLASVAVAAIIAAIDKTVAKSLSGTGTLTKTFSNLSGNPDARLEVAYLSAASYIVVVILMLLATTSLGAVREEESSSRLDNLVSGAIGRGRWLGTRLGLLVCGMVLITSVSDFVVWVVAEAQGIHVSIATMLLGGLTVLGPVLFLLGCGVLLFGLLPRITTAAMYVLIGWSFTIDIVVSALKTSKLLADTSLLHYISLVPAANPKWGTFAVLTVVGFGLMCLGMAAFQRRDLQVE